MSIEDTVVNAVVQSFSQAFFASALIVGYSVIFLYFFGLDDWDKITFGERLVLGFVVGVPFALFVLFANSIFSIIAVLLEISYPFDIISYLMSAIIITFYSVLRLQLGRPVYLTHSKEFRNPLEGRHAFFPYLPSIFMGSFLVLMALTNSAISTFSWNTIEAILALCVGLFASYIVVLAISLVLFSPSKYTELLTGEFEYLFHLHELGQAGTRVREFTQRPCIITHGWGFGKKVKAVSLLTIVVIGAYLPVANTTLALFTPRLDAVTFTSYPATNFIYVTSSAQNQSIPFVVIPVVAIYNFTIPALPFFAIHENNPSNLTGARYEAFVYSSVPTGMGRTITGPIRVVQINGTGGRILGFDVQPLWRGNVTHGSLVLRYSNRLLLSSQAFPHLRKIVDQTLSNGTRIITYSFSVTNVEVFMLNFNQFHLLFLPSNNAKYSGMICQPGCSNLGLYNQSGTRNLFGTFNILPLRTANGTIRVWYTP